jgi:hypothetical protein
MKYKIAAYDHSDGTRNFCWDARVPFPIYSDDDPKYESEDREDALNLLENMQEYGKIHFPHMTYSLVAVYE